MSKRAGFLRRVGGAVLLAVLVLTAGVPALGSDDSRRGNRVIDQDAADSMRGVEWTRVQAIDPFGVEWTLRD